MKYIKRVIDLPKKLDETMRDSYDGKKVQRSKITPSSIECGQERSEVVLYDLKYTIDTCDGVFVGVNEKVYKNSSLIADIISIYAFSNDGESQCLARFKNKGYSSFQIKNYLNIFAKNGFPKKVYEDKEQTM